MDVFKLQRSQIYRGFSTLDNNKDVVYDIDLIKIDLINHLFTRKRERVMDPDYGSIIWDLLFEPYSSRVNQLVIDDCTKIVNADPRLKLESVVVEELENGLAVYLDINYKPFDVTEPLELTFDKKMAEMK